MTLVFTDEALNSSAATPSCHPLIRRRAIAHGLFDEGFLFEIILSYRH